VEQGLFYDEITDFYDLIYFDWEGSMLRQGAAISEMLGRAPSGTRILDVSAGIGTQALPLASLGYEVVARDLSPVAIRRLLREAENRGVQIDAAASDMRDVAGSVEGTFDAVISFDNAVPHLLTDADILATFRSLSSLLSPGGVILVSVRDYGEVDRSPTSVHPYGEHVRGGHRYRMRQEWEWYDASHYRTTMIVEARRQQEWEVVVRATAAYYAIPIPRLLELMRQAGLRANRVQEPQFFQPVLRGGAG
jgi:SAM-dependent methyltransferase